MAVFAPRDPVAQAFVRALRARGLDRVTKLRYDCKVRRPAVVTVTFYPDAALLEEVSGALPDPADRGPVRPAQESA